MLALAESREEVIQQLQKDIYSTSGVWEWEKVQVHPVSPPNLSSSCYDGYHREKSVEGGVLKG